VLTGGRILAVAAADPDSDERLDRDGNPDLIVGSLVGSIPVAGPSRRPRRYRWAVPLLPIGTADIRRPSAGTGETRARLFGGHGFPDVEW
jgi:hypothetical protein